MNRQYSQKVVNNSGGIVYQNEKIFVSPRHQQTLQQQVSSNEYYKATTSIGSPMHSPTIQRKNSLNAFLFLHG